MTHATHAQQKVAAARAALMGAAERLEEASQKNTKLLVQLTEAKTRSAEALRLGRQGDTDGKHAMAMKIADADAAEIQIVLEELANLLITLNEDFNGAQASAHEAEAGARREEDEIIAAALTNHIDNLEKLRDEAVEERHQFYRKMGLNVASAALIKRIKSLELELLHAVAGCYEIHVEMDPPRSNRTARRMSSVFDFYKPCIELQDVVRSGAKPRL
ncbi:hypothetical protein [Paraburkholderia tropica]|uniref:hypothetical protein n=1 Tax=Paraburkholderia tropica TaxID=92647 RepID=UPI002AB29B94|nr:hypothetical protein [Paraburkholderia tropica]